VLEGQRSATKPRESRNLQDANLSNQFNLLHNIQSITNAPYEDEAGPKSGTRRDRARYARNSLRKHGKSNRASPGLYFAVTTDGDITSAMATLFNTAVKAIESHLSN
jgi:hypothetical protein